MIIFPLGDTQYYKDVCRVRPEGCYSSDCAVKVDSESAISDACDPYYVTTFLETSVWYNWAVLVAQGILFRVVTAIILKIKLSNFRIKKEKIIVCNNMLTKKVIDDDDKYGSRRDLMKAGLSENFVMKNKIQ